MSKTYIHYGCSEFSKDLFTSIRNQVFVKPKGGLWASSIDAKQGWKDWCIREDFCVEGLDSSFIFKISNNARVLFIDDKSKIIGLPILKNLDPLCRVFGTVYLDYEKLMEDYDAVEVLAGSNIELYHTFYGWDCDSILIMNPDIIEVIQ